MSTLQLFPARVKVTDQNGFATPEFLRALSVLFDRVGGALGDSGEDVFSVFGQSQTSNDTIQDITMQSKKDDGLLYPDITPTQAMQEYFSDIIQPQTQRQATAPEAVTVGSSPYVFTARADGVLAISGGTFSLVEYGRNGTYTSIGMPNSVTVFEYDTIRVTYTLAPTMTFIPR